MNDEPADPRNRDYLIGVMIGGGGLFLFAIVGAVIALNCDFLCANGIFL